MNSANITCCLCRNPGSAALESAALKLYRCGSCGHVFKDLKKDEQEKYPDRYFSEEHKNWFNNPDYPLFEFIHNGILSLKGKGPLRVLDAGCGKGDFLRYLRSENPALELYGIDLADNSHPGITFFSGDIMENDLGMKFDVITNLAVIEHLDAPSLFVKKMKGLLAPGGVLFTVTDNDDGMVYAIARILNKIGINAPYGRLYATHHLQCFSNRSLKLLMEANGLKTLIHKRHNHPVAAVDYPKSNFIMHLLYAAAVRLVFLSSTLFDGGILQVIVCRDKGEKS